MSKTIPAALSIDAELTSLAYCWKVVRTDGAVYGFTSHDEQLTYDGVDYEAATGFTPSTAETSGGLSVDDIEAQGVWSSDAITEADLMAGLWDYASVTLYRLNWQNPAGGAEIMRTGWLGEVGMRRSRFVAELRGLAQNYQQNIAQLYSPICRAAFTDARCGLTAGTQAATVVTVTSRREFTVNFIGPGATYVYGICTFTSGENNGLGCEVKTFVDGVPESTITLQLPMGYDVTAGDTVTLKAPAPVCVTVEVTTKLRSLP